MNSAALTRIAQETLKYLGSGKSQTDSVLHTPDQLRRLVEDTHKLPTTGPVVRVTAETSLEAARREASPTTLVLNFASANNPGGGFQHGASAQEESLARSSSLYPTLTPHLSTFYAENRKVGAPLYTDHLILSRDVTVYRSDNGTWLVDPYQVGILTVPAPNCSALPVGSRTAPSIRDALNRRARYICAVAHEQGYTNLILGAWGCGVFQNEPEVVARAFRSALALYPFEKVTFAILDSPGGLTISTFKVVLEGPSNS